MPNFNSGSNTAAPPRNVLANTTSAVIVASSVSGNTTRVGLILTNLSTGTVYIGFSGQDAILQAGTTLGAGGGVFAMDEYSYNKEAVTAIAHANGAIVAIQEFYE